MSQPQRMVSNPVELQKLSIVDKQSRIQKDQNSSSRDASPTRLSAAAPIHPGASSPRRQGIQICLPIESSPAKEIDTGDSSSISSTTPKRGSISSDHNPAIQQQQQDLLFKLAAKKRHIVELEQELQLAKKDLTFLETKYRYIVSDPQASANFNMNGEPKNEMMQNWSKRVQQTFDEVNNSPNVIKSKKSISNFFNGEPISNTNSNSSSIPSNNMTKPLPPPRPSPRTNSRPPPPPRPRSKEHIPQGRQGFLQNLKDKFNEFTVAEEEEEEFDRTQNKHKDDFYLKEKLDYDDDEEVEAEEVGGTLLGEQPKSIYKR